MLTTPIPSMLKFGLGSAVDPREQWLRGIQTSQTTSWIPKARFGEKRR